MRYAFRCGGCARRTESDSPVEVCPECGREAPSGRISEGGLSFGFAFGSTLQELHPAMERTVKLNNEYYARAHPEAGDSMYKGPRHLRPDSWDKKRVF